MKHTNAFSLLALSAAAAAIFQSDLAAQDTSIASEQFLAVPAAAHATLSEDEQLKLAALEGLMAAPAEKALPLLRKVLEGEHSDAIKSRALFVLGQITLPEAQQLLAQTARSSTGALQLEAIRAIGISGESTALAQLPEIYRDGSAAVRESVLQAYLIADDADAVYAIAKNAADDEEFDRAVRMLGAMGATSELGRLAESGNTTQGLIQAYSIAGDLDSLRKIAAQATDTEQRASAIRGIGIVGGEAAKDVLLDLYRQADDDSIREAALDAMLISEHDEGLLELFRSSSDSAEKRRLLRVLTNMNSELALELIDATLEDN